MVLWDLRKERAECLRGRERGGRVEREDKKKGKGDFSKPFFVLYVVKMLRFAAG